MSDTSQGPGWWQASDGRWYPPGSATTEPAPAADPTSSPAPTAEPEPAAAGEASAPDPAGATSGQPPAPGWWYASDGNWYPPETAAPATAAPAAAPEAGAVPPDPTAAPPTPARPVRLLPVLIGIGVVLLLIVAVVGVVKLRGRGSELSPNGVASGPDEVPSYDLTLTDDAVVVRGGGGSAVKQLGTDGRSIVLDAGASGADQIETGDVLVLTGITVGKVTSVDRSGGDVRVGLEPAAITDVISDGQLQWEDTAVDFSKASLRVWEPGAAPANAAVGTPDAGALLGDGPLQPAVIGGAGALLDAGPMELAQSEPTSGEVGGYRYEFTPRVTSDRLAFHLTVGKDADGYAILIEADVDVSNLTTNGSLAVTGGEVTNFGFNASSVDGTATVDATASTGSQYGQGSVTAINIPMSIDIPLVVGGIPLTLGVGAALSVEPAFSAADASVTGRMELRYSGSAGMSVSGTSLTGTGAFNPDSTSPEDVIGGLSISPVAVIVHLEFPKLSVGLGTALARASANVDVRSSVGVQFSGSTHVIPCAAQNQAMVVSAGITGELLGHEVDLGSADLYRQTWDYFVPDAQACVF